MATAGGEVVVQAVQGQFDDVEVACAGSGCRRPSRRSTGRRRRRGCGRPGGGSRRRSASRGTGPGRCGRRGRSARGEGVEHGGRAEERQLQGVGPRGHGACDDAVVLPDHGGHAQAGQLVHGRGRPRGVGGGVPDQQLEGHVGRRQFEAGQQVPAGLGPAGRAQRGEGADRVGVHTSPRFESWTTVTGWVPVADSAGYQSVANRRSFAMPEAVIVSAARSPIGRAGKGSLVTIRPDDLAVQMVRAALDKVPALDPTQIDDLIMGCGLPGGEQGYNIGRVVVGADGHGPPARLHGDPLLRLQPADHPDGLPRHQGGRGRRLHLGRRRDRVALREGQLGRSAGHQEPAVRRRRGPHRRERPGRRRPVARPARGRQRCRTSTSRWARPPRTWPCSRASAARSRTSSGVRSQNLAEKAIADGFWQREITPVTLPDGTVVSARRRSARGRHAGEDGHAQAGVPPRRHGSRPATAARSTTARPRWSS